MTTRTRTFVIGLAVFVLAPVSVWMIWNYRQTIDTSTAPEPEFTHLDQVSRAFDCKITATITTGEPGPIATDDGEALDVVKEKLPETETRNVSPGFWVIKNPNGRLRAVASMNMIHFCA